jgi:type IV fimbrial biogenesis protein FimT
MQAGRRRPVSIAGVTLIELLTVLVLVGLLSAWAVPAVGHWLERDRVEARAHALLATLWFARGEAVRRAQPVTVCRAGVGERCAASGQPCAGGATDWSCGWLVVPGVASVGSSAVALRTFAPEPRVSIGGPTTPLVFTPPAGQVIAGWRSLEFASRGAHGAAAVPSRCVRIALGGRARLTEGACHGPS